MPYKNKPKGKKYPILPCVDCGGEVSNPVKPYYAPKSRCDVCDKKRLNKKKTMRDRAKRPLTYCVVCATSFPWGTHAGKKYCEECVSAKEKALRDKRMRKLKGRACKDCGVELHLDALPTPSKSRTIRCGACARKVEKERKKNRRNRTPLMNAFRGIKRRCKVNGTPFDLAFNDLQIPEECPVLKKPLVTAQIGGVNPMMPSVDRTDPSKGYTKDNVVIMSHRANSLKSNATFEEVEALYKYLKGLRDVPLT